MTFTSKLRLYVLLAVAFMLAFCWTLGADEKITVKARPGVCFAPCTIKLEIRYEAHPDNEGIAVLLESADQSQASEFPAGEGSPRVFTREYRDLPAGDYEITAGLFRRDSKLYIAGQTSTHVLVKEG